MTHRSILVFAGLLMSSPAFAAAGPDLALSLSAPANVHVYQNGTYHLTISNVGNKPASSVSLVIQLPRTGTSPTVYVMGNLGAYDSRCTIAGTTLTCALGSMNKNASTAVDFNIVLPYSSAPIVFDATVSTSTSEPNQSNNSAHHVASLLTYSVAMSAPRAAVNRHCTGQSSLSSFFECELFPSSITSHDTTFNADGSIGFVGAPATFTGAWQQPAPDRLRFQYFDGPDLVAEFDGRGVSGTCFEGTTDFPNSSYISIYQVCLQ